jgi:hypothetical protein
MFNEFDVDKLFFTQFSFDHYGKASVEDIPNDATL